MAHVNMLSTSQFFRVIRAYEALKRYAPMLKEGRGAFSIKFIVRRLKTLGLNVILMPFTFFD